MTKGCDIVESWNVVEVGIMIARCASGRAMCEVVGMWIGSVTHYAKTINVPSSMIRGIMSLVRGLLGVVFGHPLT